MAAMTTSLGAELLALLIISLRPEPPTLTREREREKGEVSGGQKSIQREKERESGGDGVRQAGHEGERE